MLIPGTAADPLFLEAPAARGGGRHRLTNKRPMATVGSNLLCFSKKNVTVYTRMNPNITGTDEKNIFFMLKGLKTPP